MANLADIVTFLDRELKVADIADYPGAINGLQLANGGEVARIVAAVDASAAVIEEAAEGDGPGLLVVHHGMFWQGAQPITGAGYRKLKRALDCDLAVYSCHLPLDIHPHWGNNARLAEALGLHDLQAFFPHACGLLGLRGTWQGSRAELVAAATAAVGGPVHLCPSGPDRPHHVGLITGGAGSEVAKVAAHGIDTFITGEGPHWSYPLAEELGLNVLYAGHYATETFGVRAVATELAKQFNLPWQFIDRPSGL